MFSFYYTNRHKSRINSHLYKKSDPPTNAREYRSMLYDFKIFCTLSKVIKNIFIYQLRMTLMQNFKNLISNDRPCSHKSHLRLVLINNFKILDSTIFYQVIFCTIVLKKIYIIVLHILPATVHMPLHFCAVLRL